MAAPVINTQVFNSLKVAGKQHVSVGSHALQTYKEAASQTFKAGAPLKLVAGLATTCIAPAAGSDAEVCIGLAENDATGVTGSSCLVKPLIPGIVFEGTLANTNDDLLALTQAHVGQATALVLQATTLAWFLNGTLAADSMLTVANVRVRIVGLKDPVGTINGRVYFVFLGRGTINAGTIAVNSHTLYI